MPPAKRSPGPPPPQPEDLSRYPALETFIEEATADDILELFAPVTEALKGIKGPRALHAKKVLSAIEQTEELMQILLTTREKLAAQTRRRK